MLTQIVPSIVIAVVVIWAYWAHFGALYPLRQLRTATPAELVRMEQKGIVAARRMDICLITIIACLALMFIFELS